MQGVNGDEGQEGVVERQNGNFVSAEHGRWPPLILTCAIPLLAPAALRAGGAPLFVAASLAAGAVWLVCRSRLPELRLGPLLILSVALRLPFFLVSPTLSGDVYRYLWDGSVIAAGLDPYERSPDAPSLSHLRRSWQGEINHPEIPTVYPPAAEMLFALAGFAGASLAAWRLILLAFDAGTILVMRRMYGARRALAYSLFPPLLIEGFWSAHVEVAAVFFTLAALSALRARREGVAGASLALAAGIKIVPMAALPVFAAESRKRGVFLLSFAAAAAVPFVPFAGGRLMPGLREYATRWVFNSPVHDALLGVAQWTGAAGGLKRIWTAVKDPLGLEAISPFVYGRLYDDFLVRALMGALFVTALALIVRRRETPERSVGRSIGALLLCSPAVHPWYWLALVPFAIGGGETVWLLLAVCSSASYLLYAGVSAWVVMVLSYAPAAAYAVWVWPRFRARPQEPIQPSGRAT